MDFLESDLNFNDLLTASLGAFTAAQQFQSGLEAQGLRNDNADTLEQEARLTEEAGVLNRARSKRNFIRKQGRNKALAGGSGLTGFTDIFVDDRVSFELDQAAQRFNTEVIAFGKRRSAGLERFKGDIAVAQALGSAAITGLQTVSDLNPPEPRRVLEGGR